MSDFEGEASTSTPTGPQLPSSAQPRSSRDARTSNSSASSSSSSSKKRTSSSNDQHGDGADGEEEDKGGDAEMKDVDDEAPKAKKSKAKPRTPRTYTKTTKSQNPFMGGETVWKSGTGLGSDSESDVADEKLERAKRRVKIGGRLKERDEQEEEEEDVEEDEDEEPFEDGEANEVGEGAGGEGGEEEEEDDQSQLLDLWIRGASADKRQAKGIIAEFGGDVIKDDDELLRDAISYASSDNYTRDVRNYLLNLRVEQRLIVITKLLEENWKVPKELANKSGKFAKMSLLNGFLLPGEFNAKLTDSVFGVAKGLLGNHVGDERKENKFNSLISDKVSDAKSHLGKLLMKTGERRLKLDLIMKDFIGAGGFLADIRMAVVLSAMIDAFVKAKSNHHNPPKMTVAEGWSQYEEELVTLKFKWQTEFEKLSKKDKKNENVIASLTDDFYDEIKKSCYDTKKRSKDHQWCKTSQLSQEVKDIREEMGNQNVCLISF
ncbi:hypothetical protein JCM5350_002967 [Sporobolomyces pararoseus]